MASVSSVGFISSTSPVYALFCNESYLNRVTVKHESGVLEATRIRVIRPGMDSPAISHCIYPISQLVRLHLSKNQRRLVLSIVREHDQRRHTPLSIAFSFGRQSELMLVEANAGPYLPAWFPSHVMMESNTGTIVPIH